MRTGHRFPIVGIGASAGGLDALRRFFSNIPPPTNIGFVLVQHLDPTHESLMAELLTKCTAMSVTQAEDRMAVEPDCVYIIPPNTYLTITNGVIRLSEPAEQRGMRMPIDHFFRSLADDRQEKAICIMLTGTGSDGMLGLKEVKAKGGMAMVQSPETAQHDGMPRSAITTGLVDHVLPVEKMPEVLIRYVTHSYIQSDTALKPLEEKVQNDIKNILAILQARLGYDFHCYKKNTLIRRIQRRMSLNHVELFAEYTEYLRDRPEEAKALIKDLLISVTSFFRELEAWQTLQGKVLLPLVRQAHGDVPIRIWVPGCATGEEAYTIAMLLVEQLEAVHKHPNIQIFATDLDKQALEFARAGLYPDSIAAALTPERLARFFIKQENSFQINKQLREMVVFALQNLISDPPFSRLDLISCRNLLIYLEPELQRKVIALFHFTLRENGCLMLGSSETVGSQQNLFKPLSKKWRIYRRSERLWHGTLDFPLVAAEPVQPHQGATPAVTLPVRKISFAEITQQLLLRHYGPPCVLINAKCEVLYYFGATEGYIVQPTGHPTDDLLVMARDGLGTKLRAAIRKTQQSKQTATVSPVRIKRGDAWYPVSTTVIPVPHSMNSEGALLVVFAEARKLTVATRAPRESSEVDENLVRSLEDELKVTKEELQGTIEELITSNEELKTSNEEMMSMNEELQSTNEELETSKEELQSLNEELTTLNSQLEDKVNELEAATNDLSNLLSSTDIATIFLDTKCCVKWFTRATHRLLNLIASDVDRPLDHIARKFTDPDLLPDARTVLETLQPLEREISAEDNRWYLRSILPYRTQDNRIEGVVVTFMDITEPKRAENTLRESEQRFRLLSDSSPVLIWMSDLKAHRTFFNKAWLTFTGRSMEQELHEGWKQGMHPDDGQRYMQLRAAALKRRQPFRVEYRLRRADGEYRWLLEEGGPRRLPEDEFAGYIGSCVDITERKTVEQEIAAREEQLRRVVIDAPLPVALIAEDGEIRLLSREWSALTGYQPEEIPTLAEWTEKAYGERKDEIRSSIDKIFKINRCFDEGEFVIRTKDGHERTWHFHSSPLGEIPDGRRLIISMAMDVTERKHIKAQVDHLNRELRRRLDELQILLDVAPVGISVAHDPQCRLITSNQAGAALLGIESGENASKSQGAAERLPFKVLREGKEMTPQELPMQYAAAHNVSLHDVELDVVRGDGSVISLLEYASPLHDEAGKVRGSVGVMVDITTRKQMEQTLQANEVKLREQTRRLLEADQRKNEFLAMLAHELRNPLAPIRNVVEILKMPQPVELDPKLQWARDILDRQVEQLRHLVDDLLDVARITRGRIELQKIVVDLAAVIAQAVEMVNPLIAKRNHELQISLPAEPLSLEADPTRLTQVVANLLTNAAKFMEENGRIELTARRESREVVIKVRDQGIGIAADMLPHVFDVFSQAHRSLARSQGGLGLGLTLVRQLVAMHGGTVQAFSRGSGQGSEFTVRLPLPVKGRTPAAETSDSRQDASADNSSRRVLVVDDNQDLANSLAVVLSGLGHEVQTVYDGQAALEAVHRFAPEVVFLDIGLPGMDGYTVARCLRKAYQNSLMLVALTGYGQEEDIQRAKAAGFDHHILKPVTLKVLETLLG